MKPLFTQEEYERAKSYDKLKCECYNCNKEFLVDKRYVKDSYNGEKSAMFCSRSCNSSFLNKNNKKECNKCGRQITHNNYKKHLLVCQGKTSLKIDKYLNSNGEYECPECYKIFKKYAIGKHVWLHYNIQKSLKQSYNDGRKPMNQHLYAKKTGIPYIMKESTREKHRLAGIKQVISEERKQVIREQKIKLYQEHPEKIPFNMYKYYEKSYPEKIFEHGLTSNTITNYIYDYNVGIYYYDFAFPELQIDFEIDGDFHNKPERIIKDNFRDDYSLNNNWTVIRFEARLVLKALDYCMEQVKEIIKNFDKYKGQRIKFWYKDYINKKASPN